MNDVNLKLTGDAMDALFVDLLNDNLKRILEIDTNPYISLDDYIFNIQLANSVMSLMMFHKDTDSFDIWNSCFYIPILTTYNKYYLEHTEEY